MISAWLLSTLRCPNCLSVGALDVRGSLTRDGNTLRCDTCGATYFLRDRYVDMRITAPMAGKATVYVDSDADLDDPVIRPPLLSAGVRERVLRLLLRVRPTDALLDIGCGNGKFAVWNRNAAAHVVGLDPAARFAAQALDSVDLVQADARALPFAPGTFDGAYSIDVVEHLDLLGVRAHLVETRRVLKRTGAYFCFSNTRERSALNLLIDPGRRLSERLHEAGIVDRTRDHLRKSDHVKALETTEAVEQEFDRAGLRIDRIWYLNPLLATYVETLAGAVVERAIGRRRGGESERGKDGTAASDPQTPRLPDSPTSVRDAALTNPLARIGLRAATALLMADVIFFRAVRTGPFFLRARPHAPR
jgi:ubiquinone/menaquinone biosynthesis C-methylase UbiE